MKIFTELPKNVEKIQHRGKEVLTNGERNEPLAKAAEINADIFDIKKPNEIVNANETGESKAEIVKRNKTDGCRREESVEKELQDRYPEAEGYKVIRESYLRDKDGNIVCDPEPPHKARRIDFVVVKDGKVVDLIEVTSKTAPKEAQSAKEERIRESGGNYIKDPETGEVIRIPNSVHTRIERRN